MPNNLKSVRNLFDGAKSDKERLDYLFMAIEETNSNVEMMQKMCPWRQGECQERFDLLEEGFTARIDEKGFITRSQARFFGLIILALSVGIGLGTGTITFIELLKTAKVIMP